MAAASEGLQLEPWERFMLLAQAIEEVPEERAGALLPVVTDTAMRVVRAMQGRITKAEAYAAVERARVAVWEARKP